jgi:2-dehydropantoate 2-reductase
MRILVYGAGPLGSVIAARLQQGGHDVSLLARGQRLTDLREHGIVLVDWETEERTVTRASIVEQLVAEDTYDLVLVVMRKNRALETLPILAANQGTPNVLFLGNNFAGPADWVDALGRERVMIGFPLIAGYREEDVVHYWAGGDDHKARMLIGEVDGSITPRIHRVADALRSAPGFEVEIRSDMDAWLKTHVALLMPALAPAMYMCGTDNYRLSRTRDAVVLALRGTREGLRVLQALRVPIVPGKYRLLQWLPEPFLVPQWQRLLARKYWEVAMVRHGEAARDEVRHLVDEFLVSARTTAVPIPTIERLYPHLGADAPLLPDGSAEIPLDWRGVWVGLGAVVAVVVGLILVLMRLL